MKKLFITLLLAVFVLVPGGAAYVAKHDTATTLRLERTEGEAVSVSSVNGADVSILQGMKLYSGHQVATGMASYAYISLDGTKAAKLDANSKTEVRQSGKKLELNLAAGEIFFNVTAPLKGDEALNIRTSTMVTGVRGTSGVVSVIDENTAEIYLLTGIVTVNYTDRSGAQRTVTIIAGQKATVNVIRAADGTESTEVTVTDLTEEEVAGFAAVEIAKDETLQQQITEQTKLSVPVIIGEAEERLAADQQADKEQQEQIEKDIANDVIDEEIDPLFTEKTTGGGSSRSRSRSTTTLNGAISVEALLTALNDYDDVVIDPSGDVTLNQVVIVPTGKILQNTGMMTIENEQSLTIEGTVNNSGDIVNNGTIVNKSDNSFNHNGGSISGSGSIENSGTMTISGEVFRDLYEEYGYGYLPMLMASAAANNAGMTIRGMNSLDSEYDAPPPLITNSSSGTLNIKDGAVIREQFMTAIVNHGTLNMTGGEVTSHAWGAWEMTPYTLYAIQNFGKFIYTAGTVKIFHADGGAKLLPDNTIIYKADGITRWPVVNETMEDEYYIILEVRDE